MSIAAHLIVGAREEPFLPALLESLAGVAERVLVNDNGGDPGGINSRVLAESSFAREGRMQIDRSPFVNFADARNRVLALHRAHDAGEWAAFVDADEVHRPIAARIARNLVTLPPEVAIVDGYTRHYLQSFHWYTSTERRMSFFRVTPELRWENAVHERLAGVRGSALAIPYVYDHYGWVLPMRRQAEKGRQYAGLGQSGQIYDEAVLDQLDPDDFFRSLWPLAIRYHGVHPPAVALVRALLEVRDAAIHARADEAIPRFQPPAVRLTNVFRRFAFTYRWRGRFLDPRARRLVA
ncbi:MAG: hypothetical protein NVS3B28_16980 [Candidatus Velthaea sp.]